MRAMAMLVFEVKGGFVLGKCQLRISPV